MDSEKQNSNANEDKIPFWKKLILPTSILIVGLVVVVLLLKFVVPHSITGKDGFFTLGPDDQQSQDSFQAPAEVSTAVQLECQSSLEKINTLEKCEDQSAEFLNKADLCMSYDYAIDKPKKIPADGKFGDVVFAIAECFQKQDTSNLNAAIELLEKAKKLPEWELTFGTATCDAKAVLDAYIDSYQSRSTFNCYKSDNQQKIVDQINSENLTVIDELISKQHIPQLGQLDTDADVTCPESAKNIKGILTKALSEKAKIIQNEGEKTQDTSTVYFDLAKDANNHRALLKLNYDQNGCLYLDSLLASSLEKPEEPEE